MMKSARLTLIVIAKTLTAATVTTAAAVTILMRTNNRTQCQM